MATKLTAKQGFGAFGVVYNPGDTIKTEDLSKWPEGTLATRLENGSVAYEDDEKDTDPRLGGTNVDEAVLVSVKPFSAWGNDYSSGDVIPSEHHESWPAGTLATRLQYGDVAFKPSSEVAVEKNSAKVVTDSVGALDAGAPKTAVGDPVKDSQPVRAKESALKPEAGAPGADPIPEDERGGAETGTLDKLAAKAPQSTAEDLQRTSDAIRDRASEENDTGKEGESPLPKVDELKEHLENLESAEEVRALQSRDTRKTAAPIYEARLAELEQ